MAKRKAVADAESAVATETEAGNGNGHRQEKAEKVSIKPPKWQTASFLLVGTSPYVQKAFGAKAREKMRATQEAGSTARSRKEREARDFEDDYEQAMYATPEGWRGIPASGFRNAMISACRTVGFKMTLAKLAVFVQADGTDVSGKTALVRILQGEPEHTEDMGRHAMTTNIIVRALWRGESREGAGDGWIARVRVKFDLDQFTLTDIVNLLHRVGAQVGVGEGRPDSRTSCGLGWGLFRVASGEEADRLSRQLGLDGQ